MANNVEIKQNASGLYELWVNGSRISTGTKSSILMMAENYGGVSSPIPTTTQPSQTNYSSPQSDTYQNTNTPPVDWASQQEQERQRQIKLAEENRKNAIVIEIAKMTSRGAGSVEVNNYFSKLSPADQVWVRPMVASSLTGNNAQDNTNTKPNSGNNEGGTFQQNPNAGDPTNPNNVIGTLDGQKIYGGTQEEIDSQISKIMSQAIKANTDSRHYGKTPTANDQTYESRAFTEADRTHEIATLNSVVDGAYLDKLMSDPETIGLWVHAIAYGGYTGEDVLKDMKRKELEFKGDATAKALVIIDPTQTKNEYYSSPQGQASLSTISSLMPNIKASSYTDSEFLNYGLNMPEEIFKTLVPLLDRESEEFKDAVANVKSAYFDLANAQLQAGTEQEKAVADYQYREFKKQLEEKYGIILSDDASKAWTQIENLENTYNKAGLTDSGFENEAIDETLSSIRKADQRQRQSKLKDEEAQKAAYYTSSATPAEIAALTPEERAKYGLTPSTDILMKYDMATLKAQYPNSSEEDLKRYRDSVLDENGNYRSTLYSKFYSGVSSNKQLQKSAAETEVLEKASAKELSAFSNFDRTQFGSTTPQGKTLLENLNKNSTTNSASGSSSNTQAPANTTSYNPTSPTNPSMAYGAVTKNTTDNLTPEQSSSMKSQLDAAAKAVKDIQARMSSLGYSTVIPTTLTPTSNTTSSTNTTSNVTRDYSPLKPGESLDTYYKRIGIGA